MTTDVTLAIEVEPELRERFEAAAAAAARSPQQLLRELVQDYVDRQGSHGVYEAWFREEVEEAIREADDPSIQRIPDSILETDRQERIMCSRAPPHAVAPRRPTCSRS